MLTAMAWRRIQRMLYLVCALAALAFPSLAAAAAYHGQVTFGGFPLPGATVTVTQGTKKLTTVTDQGGLYSFADLADGVWQIEIDMQCFSTIHNEITVSANTAAAKWELTLLPLDQITKLANLPPAPLPTLNAPHWLRSQHARCRWRERGRNTQAGGGCKPAFVGRLPGERQRQQCSDFTVLARPGLRQPEVQQQEPLQWRACRHLR